MKSTESLRSVRPLWQIEYSFFWFLKHILGNKRASSVYQKRWDVREKKIHDRLDRVGLGKKLEVPRRSGISREEFFSEYLYPLKPVILSAAAASWPCIKKWTPSFLLNYDDFETISYSSKAKEAVLEPFKKSLNKVLNNESISLPFCGLLDRYPRLLEDLDLDWIVSMEHRGPKFSRTFETFVGGPGARTTLHSAWDNNLFIQIYGQKTWLIWPPEITFAVKPDATRRLYHKSTYDIHDENSNEHFPLMKYIDFYEAQLSPGDVLFNPSGYWHDVTAQTQSISVGCRWVSPFSVRKNPMQHILTILATDPLIFEKQIHQPSLADYQKTL